MFLDEDERLCAVARPVGAQEIRDKPRARDALAKEWARLRLLQTWMEDQVEEWSVVAARNQRAGTKAHVLRLAALCVEKGSELPENHDERKYKGRVVCLGNNVLDEMKLAAVFNEMSSSPSSMDAAKLSDWWACQSDPQFGEHTCMQADATQAYTQSELGGTPTWVRLPKEEWPPAWRGMIDPVCPLRLALYGHPDAGGYWEKHCEKHLKEAGFESIPAWPSCFWHKEYLMLSLIHI